MNNKTFIKAFLINNHKVNHEKFQIESIFEKYIKSALQFQNSHSNFDNKSRKEVYAYYMTYLE